MKKRILALLLALTLFAALCGCGKKKEADTSGKTVITVANWPDKTNPDGLKKMNRIKDEFMKENPDIIIKTDTYRYDTKTFTMKINGGQMADLFLTWFTELNQLVSSGYVADITSSMDKLGYTKALNPTLLDMVKNNGKIYAVPTNVYAQGLYINKKLFKQAGLVNEDGSIKVPSTYDEVAEYSKIINEKTGAGGYAMPTTENCGGWHFMNIAWSYGTEFMKEGKDGKWKATFNTPETVAALQYVKDLKWKYNSFPSNTVINRTELFKLFGLEQIAMMFAEPPQSALSSAYGMNVDDIMLVRMPEGPKGRYAQMGGDLWMFSKDANQKQIEAGIKWLNYYGLGPDIDETQIKNMREQYQTTLDDNGIVLDRKAFPVWTESERNEKETEIAKEYTNVKPENYEQYFSFDGVTVKPEEPKCCQQLYSVLDKCIQEVITNKNADCKELIKEACHDFQVNHLDKMD